MQIGTVIRKHRLEKNLTQEEMARRLGVTAPAVNKWEKGNSMPDITLLSPIARLLDIIRFVELLLKKYYCLCCFRLRIFHKEYQNQCRRK